MSKTIQRACWNAVSWAALFALLFSGGITLMEWLQNPGGVFHDAAGTRWDNVWETFRSWLLPLLMVTTVLAVLFTVVWQTLSNERQQ